MDKCKVKNGNEVVPCENLKRATESGHPRGKQKGIYAWELTKIGGSEIELSRLFYGAKSGCHVDKGIVFNFCPFCGNSIDAPVTPVVEEVTTFTCSICKTEGCDIGHDCC